jgi:hypothetical protein
MDTLQEVASNIGDVMWSSKFMVTAGRRAQRLAGLAVAAFVISAGFPAGSSVAQSGNSDFLTC